MKEHELTNDQDAMVAQYFSVMESYGVECMPFHTPDIDEDIVRSLTLSEDVLISSGYPIVAGLYDATDIIDIEKCISITDSVKETDDDKKLGVSLVPLPVLLENSDQLHSHYASSGAMIFTEYEDNETSKHLLEDCIEKGIRVIPLLNNLTQTPAALNLYQITIGQPAEGVPGISLSKVVDSGLIDIDEQVNDGFLRVRRGGQLNEEETQQLYNLFRDRFGDISLNLPFRLEESEEATTGLLQDTNNIFVYRTNMDGKIISAIFGSEDPASFPWINKEFMKQYDNSNSPYIFIPGVAAYKTEGLKASPAVMDKLASIVKAKGSDFMDIRFECTDVSSLYIPDLAKESLERTNQTLGEASFDRLGQKKYVLINF